MVNLFELLCLILLFIAVTECRGRPDHKSSKAGPARRSNKYFKFQPRKEDKKAVALFRTSVEDLPCAKKTELPMLPDELHTSDYDYYGPEIHHTPDEVYSPHTEAPHQSEEDIDSDEAIDINVNLFITSMPREESGESNFEPASQGFSIRTKNPSKVVTGRLTAPTPPITRLTKTPRPAKLPHTTTTTHSKPPTKTIKPPPLYVDDDMNSINNLGTESTDDSDEEIDINVAVIVTELPEDDDDDIINSNTIGEVDQYDGEQSGEFDESDRGDNYANYAPRVAGNTLVGVASFCSAFALTNYFFY